MNTKYACLMYHEIAYPYKHSFYVHPDEFKKQIEWLLANGYKSIDLRVGDSNGNVLITFDDGHKSNLQAARYLKEQGIVAVFYLVKDFSLNNESYLSEEEIKEIASMGHIMGVHGYDHYWWTAKSKEELIQELSDTAKWIEGLTGQKVITCSAPGGQIRRREYNIIRKNLPCLKYIRTSFHDYNKLGYTKLNSKGVGSMTNIAEFEKIVRMDLKYYFKARCKCWLKDRAKDIVFKFKKQTEL